MVSFIVRGINPEGVLLPVYVEIRVSNKNIYMEGRKLAAFVIG